MTRIGTVAVTLALLTASASSDGPPKAPADFKILIASFGAGNEPVYTEKVVVRRGRIYVLASNTTEVVVIEPERSTVDIVSVARRVQAELTFKQIDDSLAKIKATWADSAAELEKKGGKANAVEARMKRALVEPKLEVAPVEKSERLRLANTIVEVAAAVEPEPDAARLALVSASLRTIAGLGAFRVPDDIPPPFVELETIAALAGERKLRPTELSYIYKLAGPPTKIRRTYRLDATLTDREVEAVVRVDQLRGVARGLRYEQYRQAP